MTESAHLFRILVTLCLKLIMKDVIGPSEFCVVNSVNALLVSVTALLLYAIMP